MSITRHLRQSVIVLALAGAPFSVAQNLVPARPAELPPTAISETPPAPSPKVLPHLRIVSGPLSAAIEQLSLALKAADIPEPNIIFSAESREISVPDLTLRNVNANDALRLITVSAGCDMDPIIGTGNEVVGFRIFPAGGANPFVGAAAGFDGGIGGAYGRGIHPRPTVPRIEPAAELSGTPTSGFAPAADPHQLVPGAGAPMLHPPGAGAPPVTGFGMMPANAATSVRVYGLGGITNTVKFNEVEATLRETLQAGGVSSEHAKIAFHEKTNVLVMNGNQQAHDLATQLIDALQRNSAAAAAENKRIGSDRRELMEMSVRLRAEEEQRAKLSLQLEKTESLLRESQRELDRLKAATKQSL